MSIVEFQNQTAYWKNCDVALLNSEIQSDIFKSSKVQCSTILVPADYSNPRGNKAFRIQMMRIHAAKASQLIGTIFINPGGPGGSGIEQLQSSEFPKSLLARYDIIGFDPRGVGKSTFSDGTEIKCDSKLDLETYFSGDGSPANFKEYKEVIDISDAYLKDCALRNPLWWTLSTQNVVDDLELMRSAVTGTQRLNFIGSSYGTTIAGMYVTRYPSQVGKIVFDSPTPIDGHSGDSDLAGARAMESKLKIYLTSYAKHAGITFGQAWQRLLTFRKKADDNLLKGFAGTKIDQETLSLRVSSESLLVHGIRALTYFPEDKAIEIFIEAMDELFSRDWNGTFEWLALSLDGYDPLSLETEPWETRNIVRSNSYEIMSMVNTMDYSPVDSDDSARSEYIEKRAEVSPMWTKLNLDDSGYIYTGPEIGLSWEKIARKDPKIPDPPSESAPRANYSHKQLLIVGSVHEAVTAFTFAQETAKRLNSPLITVDSSVHAPVAGYDISCLNQVLLDYFLTDTAISNQLCSK